MLDPNEGTDGDRVEIATVHEQHRWLREHPCPCGYRWRTDDKTTLHPEGDRKVFVDVYRLRCRMCGTRREVSFVMDSRAGERAPRVPSRARSARPPIRKKPLPRRLIPQLEKPVPRRPAAEPEKPPPRRPAPAPEKPAAPRGTTPDPEMKEAPQLVPALFKKLWQALAGRAEEPVRKARKKKATARKAAAKKTAAKKPASKKVAVKKTMTAKKTVAKKAVTKKKAGAKKTRKK